MATTTLKAIIDRVQAVCEAAPLSLTASPQPLSFDQVADIAVDSAYYIEDAGPESSEEGSSNLSFRIDTIRVWVANRAAESLQTCMETLETTLATLERRVLADGPANSYHARRTGREIRKADDTDVMLAAIDFGVDYDFDLSTA